MTETLSYNILRTSNIILFYNKCLQDSKNPLAGLLVRAKVFVWLMEKVLS